MTKQPAGPPMTLGNMRELGVQRLVASCLNDANGLVRGAYRPKKPWLIATRANFPVLNRDEENRIGFEGDRATDVEAIYLGKKVPPRPKRGNDTLPLFVTIKLSTPGVRKKLYKALKKGSEKERRFFINAYSRNFRERDHRKGKNPKPDRQRGFPESARGGVVTLQDQHIESDAVRAGPSHEPGRRRSTTRKSCREIAAPKPDAPIGPSGSLLGSKGPPRPRARQWFDLQGHLLRASPSCIPTQARLLSGVRWTCRDFVENLETGRDSCTSACDRLLNTPSGRGADFASASASFRFMLRMLRHDQ
jgi:hypothetical protein